MDESVCLVFYGHGRVEWIVRLDFDELERRSIKHEQTELKTKHTHVVIKRSTEGMQLKFKQSSFQADIYLVAECQK